MTIAITSEPVDLVLVLAICLAIGFNAIRATVKERRR